MRVPILHPGYENPTGDWVRENIVETWAYYRLPVAHHKHLKSTNMLERFHQEINHRTLVVRIFPNAPSYLRLVRAPLAAGTYENWIEAPRYLNMDLLIEHKKQRGGLEALSR